MSCFHPLKAWQSVRPNENGKFPVYFSPSSRIEMYKEIQIPCGQCVGCRLERSRIWAVRCMAEKHLHKECCFLTLTYNTAQSEQRQTDLVPKDFVDFMKRMREKISPVKVRFFHCGEYGTEGGRPHHHVIIFGYDFAEDRKLFTLSNGLPIYRSLTLEKLWPFGFSSIGDVTFESCAYVARYIMKKQTGKDAEDYYKGKHPEYVTMSRRPGIGKGFYDLYGDSLYARDQLVIRDGLKVRPPRYFDQLFEANHPAEFQTVKKKREEKRDEKIRSDFERLCQDRDIRKQVALERCNGDSGMVAKWFADRPETITENEQRELVKLAQSKQLKRGFENGCTDL